MNNNEILRCIRSIFDFNHSKIISILGLAGLQISRDQVSAWLKKDEDPALQPCTDTELATFLNGLIIETRGPKEATQPEPEAEKKLTNNIVFMKLKIALNLQADDVLGILLLAGYEMSRHELSALFRKSDNKRYRECKDEVLLLFLKGLQMKYRDKPDAAEQAEPV